MANWCGRLALYGIIVAGTNYVCECVCVSVFVDGISDRVRTMSTKQFA